MDCCDPTPFDFVTEISWNVDDHRSCSFPLGKDDTVIESIAWHANRT